MARPRAAAFVASLIVSASAARAYAVEDDPTPVSVLIGDAVAEYDAGHYQEARALFRQAHERMPTARTLRGIGMCSFEMRDYVEASRALAASLRDQRRPLTSEQKRHAEALLARAHTFIGRFAVKLKPATASLFVDGHPAELEPDGVLLLPFGRHQLSARCATCSPTEKDQDVDVTGGEHKDVDLALAPAPPPAPDTSGTANGAGAAGGVITQQGGERDTSADQGSAHLWFTGAAVAAALGAGGSALWWQNRSKELDACQTGATPARPCISESTITSQRRVAIGATIGLGVAAVAAGAAAALLWPRSERSAPATVACVPTTNMVSCAFRF
jgi:hypothetical protein